MPMEKIKIKNFDISEYLSALNAVVRLKGMSVLGFLPLEKTSNT